MIDYDEMISDNIASLEEEAEAIRKRLGELEADTQVAQGALEEIEAQIADLKDDLEADFED